MPDQEFVALVVASGAAPREVASIEADLVIAVDSGLGPLREADRAVDVVVGDLDSADPDDLDAARAAGVRIEQHPASKDESDLELGLALALERGATTIHVVVQAGGRLDHATANLAVLASPRWADAEVEATIGGQRLWVVRGSRGLPLDVGDHLGLVAMGGDAVGVVTSGLAYPLHDERLSAYTARGIANEVVSTPVVVSLRAGVVLAISGRG